MRRCDTRYIDPAGNAPHLGTAPTWEGSNRWAPFNCFASPRGRENRGEGCSWTATEMPVASTASASRIRDGQILLQIEVF